MNPTVKSVIKKFTSNNWAMPANNAMPHSQRLV